MKTKTMAALGAALALTCAQNADAQVNTKELQEYAGALLAYQTTKDECPGMDSPVIKDRIAQLDSDLSFLYGQRWQRVKFESQIASLMYKGNCGLAAIVMIPVSMRLAADAEFQQAFKKIADKAGSMGQFASKSNEELQSLPGQMGKVMDLYASGVPTDSAINAKPNPAPAKPMKARSPNDILNLDAMRPLADIFGPCWGKNQNQDIKSDCMAEIIPKLAEINNGIAVSQTTRDYAEKFLENILLMQFYIHSNNNGYKWDKNLIDAEALTNSCVEKERNGSLNRYEVINCINGPTRKNLVPARKFLVSEIAAKSKKSDGHR